MRACLLKFEPPPKTQDRNMPEEFKVTNVKLYSPCWGRHNTKANESQLHSLTS